MNVFIDNIKAWMKKTGFEGFAGLGLGIFFLMTGAKFWAGISLGFFVTKNWDMIKEYLKNLKF